MSLVVGIDVGGTFTDFILFSGSPASGAMLEVGAWKVLSTPQDPSEGILHGLDELLNNYGKRLEDIEWLIHGTTIAPNTVIEQKGATVGLITTRGFEDIVQMGRQYRHNPFDVVHLQRHSPLVTRRHTKGVPERLRADGTIHVPLDEKAVAESIQDLCDDGVDSLAIALLHSYRFPEHELRIAEIAREINPDLPLSLSHEVTPEMREYVRFITTVVNAYVRPNFVTYVEKLQNDLKQRGFGGQLLIMKANGGVAWPADIARIPVHAMESGPAAGVHFASQIAKMHDRSGVLAFDMGGTTAKASLTRDGVLPLTDILEVDLREMRPGTGLPVAIPSVDLAEVGAGGGSIAQVYLGTIQVGPESAGSEPGPVAYGRGGTRPTVTDAALVMGHLDSENFLGGRMSLDERGARDAIQQQIAEPLGIDVEAAAWGIAEGAIQNMVHAVRAVSVDQGVDVRSHTLVATGGAGPLHATRIARHLGIEEVLVPPMTGIGSAVGLVDAPPRWEHIDASFRTLSKDFDPKGLLRELHESCRAAGRKTKSISSAVLTEVFVSAHYEGQGHSIEILLGQPDLLDERVKDVFTRFEDEYRRLFGQVLENSDIVVTKIRVSTSMVWPERLSALKQDRVQLDSTRNFSTRRKPVYAGPEFGWIDSPVIDRRNLTPGEAVHGPAVIIDNEATCVLLDGDTATLLPGNLIQIKIGAQERSGSTQPSVAAQDLVK